DVVVGHPLALVDRLDRERRPLATGPRRLVGHDSLGRPRLGRRQLHLEPALELPLLRPHLAHLWACVPLNQPAPPLLGGGQEESEMDWPPPPRPGVPGLPHGSPATPDAGGRDLRWSTARPPGSGGGGSCLAGSQFSS